VGAGPAGPDDEVDAGVEVERRRVEHSLVPSRTRVRAGQTSGWAVGFIMFAAIMMTMTGILQARAVAIADPQPFRSAVSGPVHEAAGSRDRRP
jgi:hypothetical protein